MTFQDSSSCSRFTGRLAMAKIRLREAGQPEQVLPGAMHSAVQSICDTSVNINPKILMNESEIW